MMKSCVSIKANLSYCSKNCDNGYYSKSKQQEHYDGERNVQ